MSICFNSRRSPKALQAEKSSSSSSSQEVDYKIESGDFDPALYEYEDEEVQDKAKGQPQRQPSEEEDDEDDVVPQPPVAMVIHGLPAVSTPQVQESEVPNKPPPSSATAPIVLKQSNLLQSVPASRFHPQNVPVQAVPTTPTTTTTTANVQSGSEPVPSVRPVGSTRFRGSGQSRVRGEVKPETEQSPAAVEEAETPTRVRPAFTRG